MAAINRKQFLEELIGSQLKEKPDSSGDIAFKKHTNKTLPAAKKTTTGISPYTGPWTETQVKHLLRRTMFGVTPAHITTLSSLSVNDAVDLLINTVPAPPLPPVNDYTLTGPADITGIELGQTWVTAPYGIADLNVSRIFSYKAWWFRQIIDQDLSITEKMVFFWHNHFSTQTQVVLDARLSYVHNTLLRSYATGNFKTLVRLITTDSSMLRYLNGNQNTKNNPDENYGRELQELFTVGKNNNPNYTEDDVKAASHILTGWNVNLSTLESFFTPQYHDTSTKTFSSFYNNTVITGLSGSAGATETDALIDMIFTKREAAHFIVTKLYRFFVYYNIDTSVEDTVIGPLTQLLIDSNFETKPVLLALFKSEHFYDPANIGCYIKTPLDLIAGYMRTFNVTIPPALNVIEQQQVLNYLRDYAGKIGLDLGDPPNVAGWGPFYQSPSYHQLWINTSTLPFRMEFTDMMLTEGFTSGTSGTVVTDILGFTKQCTHPDDPVLLVSWLTGLLLGMDVSTAELDSLKSILLSGQSSDHYWTDAWNEYIANPNAENTAIVTTRLSSLLITITRLPEFQLC